METLKARGCIDINESLAVSIDRVSSQKVLEIYDRKDGFCLLKAEYETNQLLRSPKNYWRKNVWEMKGCKTRRQTFWLRWQCLHACKDLQKKKNMMIKERFSDKEGKASSWCSRKGWRLECWQRNDCWQKMKGLFSVQSQSVLRTEWGWLLYHF